MWKDPIIEEVRKHRLEIEAECHNDSKEILQRALEIQKKYGDRLTSRPKHDLYDPIPENKLAEIKKILQAPPSQVITD